MLRRGDQPQQDDPRLVVDDRGATEDGERQGVAERREGRPARQRRTRTRHCADEEHGAEPDRRGEREREEDQHHRRRQRNSQDGCRHADEDDERQWTNHHLGRLGGNDPAHTQGRTLLNPVPGGKRQGKQADPHGDHRLGCSPAGNEEADQRRDKTDDRSRRKRHEPGPRYHRPGRIKLAAPVVHGDLAGEEPIQTEDSWNCQQHHQRHDEHHQAVATQAEDARQHDGDEKIERTAAHVEGERSGGTACQPLGQARVVGGGSRRGLLVVHVTFMVLKSCRDPARRPVR